MLPALSMSCALNGIYTVVILATLCALVSATSVAAVEPAAAAGSHTRVRPTQWLKSVDDRAHAGFGSALAASDNEYLLVGAEGQGAGMYMCAVL